jgi:hypothetical protein
MEVARVRSFSLLILFCFLCFAWDPGARAQEANIRFLTQAEARSALTEGEAREYYALLQLGEMRAKTGLPLQNLGLAEARERVRAVYGERTLDFSPEEQAMLREAVTSLQPGLRERAPLYARTPWSFIKVAATLEGGLPHTRGDSIVLCDALLAQLLRAHAHAAFTQPSGLWNLLVHEQTHVLQRGGPGRFADLYTQVFGFRHVVLEPAPPWLRVRNVVNPDGPSQDWAFPDGEGEARRWLVPEIQLRTLDAPRMPEDFAVIATPVRAHGSVWQYLDRTAPEAPQQLADFGFFAKFPIRDELFHPNEIAAGLLAALLTDYGQQNPDAALWQQTRQWSIQGLR